MDGRETGQPCSHTRKGNPCGRHVVCGSAALGIELLLATGGGGHFGSADAAALDIELSFATCEGFSGIVANGAWKTCSVAGAWKSMCSAGGGFGCGDIAALDIALLVATSAR